MYASETFRGASKMRIFFRSVWIIRTVSYKKKTERSRSAQFPSVDRTPCLHILYCGRAAQCASDEGHALVKEQAITFRVTRIACVVKLSVYQIRLWYLTIWELVWGLIRRQSTITHVTRWMIQLHMSMSTRSPKRKKKSQHNENILAPSIDRLRHITLTWTPSCTYYRGGHDSS
jgi:hypothetical protein